MFAPQPQATKVTTNVASSVDMASRMVGENSEILNKISTMNQDLQQNIQKVGDDVIVIKDKLDSLKLDVAKLGSRTSEAEGRISQVEDENICLVNLSRSMDSKITQLEARLEYEENYSKRNNIQIKGVPKPFVWFTDREKVRLRAKELRTFQQKGAKVDFFPDFTKNVQNKRNAFTEVKHICMKRGLQYSMQYPAVFWVTVDKTRHRFEDAATAKRPFAVEIN